MSTRPYNDFILLIMYTALVIALSYSLYSLYVILKQYRLLKPNLLFDQAISKDRIIISVLVIMGTGYRVYSILLCANEISMVFLMKTFTLPYIIMISLFIYMFILTKVTITDKGLIVFAPLRLPVTIVQWEDIDNYKFGGRRIVFNYSKKKKSYKIELKVRTEQEKLTVTTILDEYLDRNK